MKKIAIVALWLLVGVSGNLFGSPSEDLLKALKAKDMNQLTFVFSQPGSQNLSTIEIKMPHGDTSSPLIEAVKSGSQEAVDFLLRRWANVKYKTKLFHNTALHIAARNNNTAIAKLLLENGADVNARNALEETPLFEAARNGNLEMVKLLIDKGADDRAINKIRESALTVAPADKQAVRKYIYTIWHQKYLKALEEDSSDSYDESSDYDTDPSSDDSDSYEYESETE